MKYYPACEVSCLTQSSEMLFQQSSSRGSSNLQSGYCSWDGDWEGGWWRELEEEEEEVKDHEEGEETRASTFTPHHTELKCLLRYAWRSHTHTIREDQSDSPPPPVSCSCLSLHRRLQSNIDCTPLNSRHLSRNTSSNASWSVRLNSFSSSCRAVAPARDVRHYATHSAGIVAGRRLTWGFGL